MFQSQKAYRLLSAIALLAGLAACKPDYPNCDNDTDCQMEGMTDVCFNGMCQECIEDSQCVAKSGEGYTCMQGRCEEPPKQAAGEVCSDDSNCADGLICQENVCQDPNALASAAPSLKALGAACDEGTQCESGSCIQSICSEANIQAQVDECAGLLTEAADGIMMDALLFDFNDANLTPELTQRLQTAAECIKRVQRPVVIEGHCDDRGTQEYNLALGEKRANAVRNYLKALGVAPKHLVTRSMGENKPRCLEANEECWSQNRRVEFVGN